MGTITSINVSPGRGTTKEPVDSCELVAGQGIRGDGHEGFGRRQVSLLPLEAEKEQAALLEKKGLSGGEVEIRPGVYAENLTVDGVDFENLAVGDELRAGPSALLRVTQIGKECHSACAIMEAVGDCIMPRLGLFCEVLRGGPIKIGDDIEKC